MEAKLAERKIVEISTAAIQPQFTDSGLRLASKGFVVTARCDDASVWVLSYDSGDSEISEAEWKRLPSLPQPE